MGGGGVGSDVDDYQHRRPCRLGRRLRPDDPDLSAVGRGEQLGDGFEVQAAPSDVRHDRAVVPTRATGRDGGAPGRGGWVG